MVSTQILGAGAILRDTFLEKVNNQKEDNKVIFVITYYPVF